MTSFRSYLANRRTAENPAGEFTRKIRDDPEMEKIEDWPQLQAYIYRKAPSDKIKDTIAAAEPVWKGYRPLSLNTGAQSKSRRTNPDYWQGLIWVFVIPLSFVRFCTITVRNYAARYKNRPRE
jgi:hypothetical protein